MKRIITAALIALSFCTISCQKWLDINTNPNYVADAEISSILPSVQLNLADKVGYDLALYGHFWSQYVNQNKNTNQYYTVMTYDVTNSDFNSVWSYLYARCLPNLRTIITKANADQLNYVLEAKSMLAYSLYLLTSLFDQVAYTEGYLTSTTTPKFDTGVQMQGNIISLLEEIRAMDMEAVYDSEIKNSTLDSDLIFGGDIDAWCQFVNTLYLKVLMRDFNTNKAKIQSLLEEDDFLTVDACFAQFEDKADKSNPFFESDRRMLNTNANIRACTDILNVLQADDPRLDYYYDQGGCKGAGYGITTKPDESGRLALGPLDPVYFSTVDEVEYLKAECYARLGDVKMAQESYENAIIACFDRLGLAGGEEAVENYGFSADADEEAMVETIINQKWASNVRGMAIESWFDLNRTGYPQRGATISDYKGVIGGYPQRFIYSKTSAEYNANSPTPEPVTSKMWWHK